MKSKCVSCAYNSVPVNGTPCRQCIKGGKDELYKPLKKQYYDEHYVSEHQPIEVMQSNMTHEEFIGFLKGNIIKYTCRLGKKDGTQKEVAKIKRYSEWLEKAINDEKIDPRK